MSLPGIPRILIAIPACNEEKYIGSLVLKSRQHAREVIVLDDGSQDDTAVVATLAGATVLRHQRNEGKGAALRHILSEARKINPDVLVLLDADFQHNPDEIPYLIKPVFEGYDLVIGSRQQQKSKIPTFRRFGQNILSRGTNVLAGGKVTDSQSGFRALSSRAIAQLELTQDGFAVDSEMIAAAAARALKVKEVPISAIYHEDGSLRHTVGQGVGVLTRITAMIAERRPLFFFGVSGAIAIAAGIIAGIKTVNAFVVYRGVIPPGTVVLSAIFLIVGTFSVFTGIVLHALARKKA